MTEEKNSGLDAVEEGPQASDSDSTASPTSSALVPEHASVTALRARFGDDAVQHYEVTSGDQHVVFIPAERNVEILGWLKNDENQRYDFLSDVTAVDYGGGRPLHVVYQLWSLVYHRQLRVKCELPVAALEIGSVEPLWKTADWLEREVFDLFGITFQGHPDLRRIMMPDDYAEGHPLRKDFPLRGRFSRAEQTRRALSQDVAFFYTPEELEMGHNDPQVVGGASEDTDPTPS